MERKKKKIKRWESWGRKHKINAWQHSQEMFAVLTFYFSCNDDTHTYSHAHIYTQKWKISSWALELREEPCLDRLSEHSLPKCASDTGLTISAWLKSVFTSSRTNDIYDFFPQIFCLSFFCISLRYFLCLQSFSWVCNGAGSSIQSSTECIRDIYVWRHPLCRTRLLQLYERWRIRGACCVSLCVCEFVGLCAGQIGQAEHWATAGYRM